MELRSWEPSRLVSLWPGAVPLGKSPLHGQVVQAQTHERVAAQRHGFFTGKNRTGQMLRSFPYDNRLTACVLTHTLTHSLISHTSTNQCFWKTYKTHLENTVSHKFYENGSHGSGSRRFTQVWTKVIDDQKQPVNQESGGKGAALLMKRIPAQGWMSPRDLRHHVPWEKSVL